MFRRSLLSFMVALFPWVAYAQAPRTFKELVDMIVGLVNTGIGLLVVAGIVVFLWGISSNIVKFEEDPDKRKAYFFWGIVILFVMMSIWGILRLLQITLSGWGVET